MGKVEGVYGASRDDAISTLNALPDLLFEVDRAGRIADIRPACSSLFAAPIEESIGKPLQDVFSKEAGDALAKALAQAAETGHHFGAVCPLDTPGGRRRLELSIAVKEAVSGPDSGLIILARDVTERQEQCPQNTERAQQAQKLGSLGVMAGGIAHEFNNLLMGILGNAELALMTLPPEAPQRAKLEEISKAGHRAANICNQMLAYSGHGRFVVERINLSKLIEDMAGLLSISIAKKVTLEYHLTAGLPHVVADHSQLYQLISALVTNASEAIEDCEGVICITTRALEADRAYLANTYIDDGLPEGTYVCLEVADTGCGMDAETLARAFDPFFTTKFPGRGLGLAAVLGIVRGHKGALTLESEPGRGTTFRMLLPMGQS